MKEDKRLGEIRERLRQISIEYGDLEKEAGKIQRDIWEKERKENNKAKCECGHVRVFHGKSFNINFTGGACKKCRCNNFRRLSLDNR